MVDCTVDQCVSEKEGGAVANQFSMTAERCTFSNNKANDDDDDKDSPGGGAIASFHDLSLTNCTLTGNTAHYGGAIDQLIGSLGTDPVLTLLHCTVARNQASEVDGAGGIYAFYDWTMAACIMAENTSSAGTGSTVPDDVQNDGGVETVGGPSSQTKGLTLAGPSLVQAFHNVRGGRIGGKTPTSGGAPINGLVPAGAVANLLVADPLLAALADNGGFSGSLVLTGAKYSFKGTLDSIRTATIQLTGRNLPTLTLTVSGPQDNELTASVSGGGIAAVTDGTADASGFSKKNPVPDYLVRTYSVVLGRNVGTNGLTGFGSLTVGKTGRIKFIGVLDDGTPFAFGTQLAGSDLPGDQSFSIRVPLYKKKGYVQLRAAFTTDDQTTTPFASVAQGTATWVRPAGVNDRAPASYAGGVDDNTITVTLTPYLPPVKGAFPTAGFAAKQGAGTLNTGEGLPDGELTFTLNPNGKATSPTVGFKLRLSTRTGLFGGVFPDPNGGTQVARFGGVLLNDPIQQAGTTVGAGVVLTASTSDLLRIESAR